MNIHDVIQMIPEDSQDEALGSIEGFIIEPYHNRAKVRCLLANEFRLLVEVKGRRNQSISISAENWPSVTCQPDVFIAALRRFIYDMDEAIANKRYQQTPPKPNIIHMPTPPKHMDIPVWDEEMGQWYDAEY